MEKQLRRIANILNEPCSFIRNCIFNVLKVGPIPNHIAFIMDGNRRFAKKKLEQDGPAAAAAGHDAGFLALLCILMYCYELGVKYITAYAFSIDNFKRKPDEVEELMDLMSVKVQLLATIAPRFAVKVHFAGNLEFLRADLRESAKKLVEITADYSGNSVLTICVAYSSTDEILHSIQETCKEKLCQNVHNNHGQEICFGDDQKRCVKLMDIEKNMYMAIAPDPDIVIRTGGVNRLSNFLLWQSCCSHLCTMFIFWPDIGFWHLISAVLNFQRNYPYFDKKKRTFMM